MQHERPQTIALVLSYVDPQKSAAVIDELDPERQVKVVESIATMESASPAAVKIIEAELEKRFSSLMTTNNVKVGGVDYVADVMNNLDRASEKSIFDRLSAHNADLADEIRKRMFVFEDIVTMDDRSVQRFVRDCDPKDLVLALKAPTAMWPTRSSPMCPAVWRRASGTIWRLQSTSASRTWRPPSSVLWASSGTWRRRTS